MGGVFARMYNKVYLQSQRFILDTIQDIKEMQNGKGTFADIPNGKIHFVVKAYYLKWEYQFTVTDIGNNRSKVELDIDGEVKDKKDMILRMFVLLDSMLVANTKIELSKKEQPESADGTMQHA